MMTETPAPLLGALWDRRFGIPDVERLARALEESDVTGRVAHELLALAKSPASTMRYRRRVSRLMEQLSKDLKFDPRDELAVRRARVFLLITQAREGVGSPHRHAVAIRLLSWGLPDDEYDAILEFEGAISDTGESFDGDSAILRSVADSWLARYSDDRRYANSRFACFWPATHV